MNLRMQVLCGLLSVVYLSSAAADEPSVRQAFEQFGKDFDRHYLNDEEVMRRFLAFERNYRFIEQENAKSHTYKLGLTRFADLDQKEFLAKHTGFRAGNTMNLTDGVYMGMHVYSTLAAPASVDWRTKGAVTPVKNQGQCGSCWSFGTTGAIEGAWAIATGRLLSLSEQQFVDCAGSFGEKGCSGGNPITAYQFAQQNSLCTEQSYPYTAADGVCTSSACTMALPVGSVVGYHSVAPDDTNALMDAVSQQPVSVIIEADQQPFQLYKSGVLSQECDNQLDHAVLAVGYGTDQGQDYWLIKNSWGEQWGEAGYLRMLRGNAGDGECGIKAQPTYPVVKSNSPAPVPPAPPAPAPPPAPDCRDIDDCSAITTADTCPLILNKCLNTCGCCSAQPPEWCNTHTTIIVV